MALFMCLKRVHPFHQEEVGIFPLNLGGNVGVLECGLLCDFKARLEKDLMIRVGEASAALRKLLTLRMRLVHLKSEEFLGVPAISPKQCEPPSLGSIWAASASHQ